jgi:hypothetical protein
MTRILCYVPLLLVGVLLSPRLAASDSSKVDLYGVWGDDKEVIVVGYNGTILRSKNHKTWTKISSGTKEHLVSVWSDGAGKHVAVGAAGSVIQF